MKLADNIDKWGTAGLFLTALFSPCCFPLFAFAASAFGLGSIELFGTSTMWIFQLMIVISIAGLALAYRIHRNAFPVILSLISALLILYGYHFSGSAEWMQFIYAGMAGLFFATVLNYYFKRNYKKNARMNNQNPITESMITCPECGYSKIEVMPLDSCQFFYRCEHCKTVLKPLAGDCCVYCSYGSIKCPSVQDGMSCC